jgi:hypothetical protein
MDLQIQPETMEITCREACSFVVNSDVGRIRVFYLSKEKVIRYRESVTTYMEMLGFTGPIVETEGREPRLIQIWERRQND